MRDPAGRTSCWRLLSPLSTQSKDANFPTGEAGSSADAKTLRAGWSDGVVPTDVRPLGEAATERRARRCCRRHGRGSNVARNPKERAGASPSGARDAWSRRTEGRRVLATAPELACKRRRENRAGPTRLQRVGPITGVPMRCRRRGTRDPVQRPRPEARGRHRHASSTSPHAMRASLWGSGVRLSAGGRRPRRF